MAGAAACTGRSARPNPLRAQQRCASLPRTDTLPVTSCPQPRYQTVRQLFSDVQRSPARSARSAARKYPVDGLLEAPRAAHSPKRIPHPRRATMALNQRHNRHLANMATLANHLNNGTLKRVQSQPTHPKSRHVTHRDHRRSRRLRCGPRFRKTTLGKRHEQRPPCKDYPATVAQPPRNRQARYIGIRAAAPL